MAFAPINSDFSYWQKQHKPLFSDLLWNIPEQKTGRVNIIGGNGQNFHNIVRVAEFINQNFPVQELRLFLPDVLRHQLPPLPFLNFLPSTSSGSFAKSFELDHAFLNTDFILTIGDLSKNSATAIAFNDAIAKTVTNTSAKTTTDITDTPKPLLLTRDTIDLLAPSFTQILQHPNLYLVATMVQLQKIFRSIFYPKMIMLSQPLIPIIETLHKFTLSYPDLTILTFHENNIIVAHNGNITTTNLVDTSYSAFSLWSGQLAAKVAMLNLYNPHKQLEATTAAILFN